jgi:hypothetical protein
MPWALKDSGAFRVNSPERPRGRKLYSRSIVWNHAPFGTEELQTERGVGFAGGMYVWPPKPENFTRKTDPVLRKGVNGEWPNVNFRERRGQMNQRLVFAPSTRRASP